MKIILQKLKKKDIKRIDNEINQQLNPKKMI